MGPTKLNLFKHWFSHVAASTNTNRRLAIVFMSRCQRLLHALLKIILITHYKYQKELQVSAYLTPNAAHNVSDYSSLQDKHELEVYLTTKPRDNSPGLCQAFWPVALSIQQKATEGVTLTTGGCMCSLFSRLRYLAMLREGSINVSRSWYSQPIIGYNQKYAFKIALVPMLKIKTIKIPWKHNWIMVPNTKIFSQKSWLWIICWVQTLHTQFTSNSCNSTWLVSWMGKSLYIQIIIQLNPQYDYIIH